MKLLRTFQELKSWRLMQNEDVGFVPTMGNLHQGHLSLLETSLSNHKASVISIFVNPMQFGPKDDFAKYPRTLEADIKLCEVLLKNHTKKELVVFAPSDTHEIYPDGFSTVISVPRFDEFLEGAMRPGHFNGVATVVFLLFQMVKPRTAYFGKKDYQQYRLIKQMARDLSLPIHVKGMPIIRDESGLALSSRNQYLSAKEKSEALYLFQTLQHIKQLFAQSIHNYEKVKNYIQKELEIDSRWQYLEVREARRLHSHLPNKGRIVILGVLKVGEVRLLDNMEVELL
jgi:pantoate--beta-alanine ligase